MYVPDNIEIVGTPSQNVPNSDLTKSRICPIWDQSDILWAQIWSPWFGKLQMKQQGRLDDGLGNRRLLNIF